MQPLSKEQMLEMLLYYARGLRAQDIAEVEHLSIHAVNNRLKKVKSVMNCKTTTEAVVKAIAKGDLVIELNDDHSYHQIRLATKER